MTTISLVLIFLSSTAICHGQESEEPELPPLPTPTLTKITTFDPPGFTVEWAPVVNDEKNPVTGFRVQVWEHEKEVYYFPEEIEGLGKVWIKELRPIVKPIHVIPNTEPLVIEVEANATEARFEDIKLNEDYQIRVQAFNDDGENGPYSNVLGVKLLHEKKS